jgi:hypothetical protein
MIILLIFNALCGDFMGMLHMVSEIDLDLISSIHRGVSSIAWVPTPRALQGLPSLGWHEPLSFWNGRSFWLCT